MLDLEDTATSRLVLTTLNASELLELLKSLESNKDSKLMEVYKAIENFENYLIRTPYILNSEVGATYKENMNILKTEIKKNYNVNL